MKTTVEELDDNRVKLSVEVDADEFEVEVDKAFRKIAREVRLPGFRKGKVPRRVLEARFGSELARGQALEDSIPDYFLTALGDYEIDMISPPEYEIVSGEQDGPVAFDAVVEVRPSVDIEGYHDMTVEVPRVEPSEEDIEGRIEGFLEQFAELADADRPAVDGDRVTVDLQTELDGEPFDGLTADDYTYPVGSGGITPEFDENLTGVEVGDVVEFESDFPGDDGETLAFRVLVKQVQEKVLPELTDEIVSNSTDFDTVDDYRADTIVNLREARVDEARRLWHDRSASQLGELIDVEPPKALVDVEVRNQLENMIGRFAQMGIQLEQYLEMTGQSIEEMVDQMQEPATQAVKVDLALRALASAEGLEATDADVDAEFESIAEGSGMEVSDLRERISTANQLMLMKADISIRKAAEWLLDVVDVVDEDGNPVDKAALHLPDPDHADAPTIDEEE